MSGVHAMLDAARALLRTASRPTPDSATAQVNAGALDRLRDAVSGGAGGADIALEMSRKAALAERRAEGAEDALERVLAEIQALPITCIDGVNYVSRRDIVALRGGGGS